MAIQVYNVKNHSLNGEMLRKFFAYITSETTCIFIEQPNTDVNYVPVFKENDTKVKVNPNFGDTLTIIGGGCIFSIDVADINDREISVNDSTICGIRVYTDFDGDNFATVYTNTSTDNNNDNVKLLFDNSLPVESGVNHTIYTADGFIIPLFRIDPTLQSHIEDLIQVWEYDDLLKHLTQEEKQQFLNNMDNKYVHRSGSTKDNPNYGKVAKFKFNGDSLYYVSDDDVESLLIKVDDDCGPTLSKTKYSQGALYVQDEALIEDPSVIVPRVVKSGPLPVRFGGTGAESSLYAKQNLGIYYGTEDPNVTSPVSNPNEGDVYFRILGNSSTTETTSASNNTGQYVRQQTN